MTKEDQAFRADGPADGHRIGRRERARGVVAGVAPVVIVAGIATLALALSGCSTSSPLHAARLDSVRPRPTASHSARPAHRPSATPRASHTVRPVPTATAAPLPAPTSVPQTTTVPQQNCYAEPDPTCTVPPPPSGLRNSPYTTAPTTRPSPIIVITETP